MPIDNSQSLGRASETPLGIGSLEQRIPAQAKLTDQQPSRHLLYQTFFYPINYCETRFKRLRSPPQIIRFGLALISHNRFTRAEAKERQIFY